MNRMNSERNMGITSLYSVTSGYHNPHSLSYGGCIPAILESLDRIENVGDALRRPVGG